MSSTEIFTNQGTWIDPLHPKDSEFRIETIAKALSKICRFNGHTNRFYSVAQHCLFTNHILNSADHTVNEEFGALLHDASEAYMGDLATPIKNSPGFSIYKTEEAKLGARICTAYTASLPDSPAVKTADSIAFGIEAAELLSYKDARMLELIAWKLTGVDSVRLLGLQGYWYDQILPLSMAEASDTYSRIARIYLSALPQKVKAN